MNTHQCLRCTKHRLLKLPEDKAKARLQSKFKSTVKKKDAEDNSKESWKDLEATVASGISVIPTTKQYEARRQTRSGAIWFMPGDVADTVILAECKERCVETKAGKSIAINKRWLDKILEEADTNQYPVLVFRYKGSDEVYFTMQFEYLCDMVTEIKYLREENERLRSMKGGE